MRSYVGFDIKCFHLLKCSQDLRRGPARQAQIVGFLPENERGVIEGYPLLREDV